MEGKKSGRERAHNDTPPSEQCSSLACRQPSTKKKRILLRGLLEQITTNGWLKATEIDCPTVLEAKGLESRCQKGRAFSEGSRGESVPCLSLRFWCRQQSLAFLG